MPLPPRVPYSEQPPAALDRERAAGLDLDDAALERVAAASRRELG